jgi:hypothetical protein
MNEAAPGTDVTPEAPVSAFDFLLRTDVAAVDSTEVAVTTPAASAAPAFDFSDRPERTVHRAGPVDWAALVLAIIAPPVGLLTSIVARILSSRTRGWTSAVARAATVVGIILTIALAIGGGVLTAIGQSDVAEAKLVADSAPFCASLAETPGVLELPGFGWPTEKTALAETLVAMQAYTDRWKGLTDVAPDGIRIGVRSVADAGQTLVSAVSSTQTIDRVKNLSQIESVTAASGIPAYVATYCG